MWETTSKHNVTFSHIQTTLCRYLLLKVDMRKTCTLYFKFMSVFCGSFQRELNTERYDVSPDGLYVLLPYDVKHVSYFTSFNNCFPLLCISTMPNYIWQLCLSYCVLFRLLKNGNVFKYYVCAIVLHVYSLVRYY